MITIGNRPADTESLALNYDPRGIERKCLSTMSKSDHNYTFSSTNELDFLLQMRGETVRCSDRLYRSRLNFAVFQNSFCNEDYWIRSRDGGWELKRSSYASDAIEDIYLHGGKYGTECATAMQIIYYGAIDAITDDDSFDRQFRGIRLMNWHNISPALQETGRMQRVNDYFPGDRRYLANPDVDPRTPYWQGENVIDMGDGTYYGHGVGRLTANQILSRLNAARRPDATRSAYLMETVGIPNYKNLFRIFGPVNV